MRTKMCIMQIKLREEIKEIRRNNPRRNQPILYLIGRKIQVISKTVMTILKAVRRKEPKNHQRETNHRMKMINKWAMTIKACQIKFKKSMPNHLNNQDP